DLHQRRGALDGREPGGDERNRAIPSLDPQARELAALDHGRRVLCGTLLVEGPVSDGRALRSVSPALDCGSLGVAESLSAALCTRSACMKAGIATVCFFGPESTGKTTLGRDLAGEFHAIFVPEYGRYYC